MNKHELDNLYQIFETPEEMKKRRMRKGWRFALRISVLAIIIVSIAHFLTEIPGTEIILSILSFTTIVATVGFVTARMW